MLVLAMQLSRNDGRHLSKERPADYRPSHRVTKPENKQARRPQGVAGLSLLFQNETEDSWMTMFHEREVNLRPNTEGIAIKLVVNVESPSHGEKAR